MAKAIGYLLTATALLASFGQARGLPAPAPLLLTAELIVDVKGVNMLEVRVSEFGRHAATTCNLEWWSGQPPQNADSSCRYDSRYSVRIGSFEDITNFNLEVESRSTGVVGSAVMKNAMHCVDPEKKAHCKTAKVNFPKVGRPQFGAETPVKVAFSKAS